MKGQIIERKLPEYQRRYVKEQIRSKYDGIQMG